MQAVDLYTGDKWSIRGLADSRRCWALEYINALQPSDQDRIESLLERTVDHGLPHNEEKFKKLEGKLFEFKSHQDRLLCFFHGPGVLIVTHGYRKKSNKAPKSEIRRAAALRAAYLETQ